LVPLFDYQNQLQNLLFADSVTWKRFSVCASEVVIRVVDSTVQKRLASQEHNSCIFALKKCFSFFIHLVLEHGQRNGSNVYTLNPLKRTVYIHIYDESSWKAVCNDEGRADMASYQLSAGCR
jgi:hypothetical protein